MSFSDFYASDLSEITSSEDDEEFVPNTVKRSSAKKPKRDQQPYTIPNPLRPPRSTSYSVRALYGLSFLSLSIFFPLTPLSEQIVDGSIDLDPDYQRGTLVLHLVRRNPVASPSPRCCLVRTKANRAHRLCLSQLLHSTYHLW